MPGKFHHPMLTDQKALERDMALATRESFWQEINEAKQTQNLNTTKPGRHVLSATVIPMTEAIRQWIEDANTGKAGRKHSLLPIMEQGDPEVMAYLCLKYLLSAAGKPMLLSTLSGAIGAAIQSDIEYTQFREEHTATFKRQEAKWKRAGTTTEHTKAWALNRLMYLEGFNPEPWSHSIVIKLGSLLLEICEQLGFAEIQRISNGRNAPPIYVSASEGLMDALDDASTRAELLSPKYWPMVCPPKKWTAPWNGGYWTSETRRLPVIKTHNRRYLEELGEMGLEPVYEALNAMQETPWRVHPKVLEVYEWALNHQEGIAKLPPIEDFPLPPKPHDIADNEAAKKEWKKEAAKTHGKNAKLKSKRVQARTLLRLAKQFSEYKEIYYPYQLDFRGRAYAVPMFLQPQGADPAKALLTFSKGKPIDTKEAADWLAVHEANVYGNDKIAMDDRVLWTEVNSEQIIAAADDPYSHTQFWTEADKPWQFLAFCFEWAAFKREGYGFVSTLPIQLDGSCNGLQHYSAALRDPEGGAAVNLTPSQLPKDIYGQVAERSMDVLKQELTQGNHQEGSREWLIQKLVEQGLTRKVCKKAVMCLPYGLSQFSAKDYIQEGLEEMVGEGKESPFAHLRTWEDGNTSAGTGYWEASKVLTPIVWRAIQETVSGAAEAMAWLQKCSRLVAAEGVTLNWTTPDGLYIEQTYNKQDAKRVSTVIHGSVAHLRAWVDNDKIDKRKSGLAIAPNWVHSMDATALRMYVVRAKQQGIRHFALVHDSYGTLAADVETMNRTLREAFVEMYEDHDVLEDFRQSILEVLPEDKHHEVPAVPEKGTLDIRDVLDSTFFFA